MRVPAAHGPGCTPNPAYDNERCVEHGHLVIPRTPEPVVPHDHGCPVEQIHRVWTTNQGVDPWVLAEEVLRFVQPWRNRRCTCVSRSPKRPDGVPLTSVYDPDSGLWRPPATVPPGPW